MNADISTTLDTMVGIERLAQNAVTEADVESLRTLRFKLDQAISACEKRVRAQHMVPRRVPMTR